MNEKPKTHPECYGQLFLDLEHLHYNKSSDGRAFQVLVEQIGLGTQRRELKVKQQQWEECVACTDFRGCYELGMAKLALQAALSRC
jgi:hypothetical protein